MGRYPHNVRAECRVYVLAAEEISCIPGEAERWRAFSRLRNQRIGRRVGSGLRHRDVQLRDGGRMGSETRSSAAAVAWYPLDSAAVPSLPEAGVLPIFVACVNDSKCESR